jgi:hypothetical protein
MRLSLTEAEKLVTTALSASGAGPQMAKRTAAALVAAEAAGQAGHGLSRVAQYAAFLRNGRADGPDAQRRVERTPPAAPRETENIRAPARGATLVAVRSNVRFDVTLVLAQAGCACRRTPRARATFNTVAKLGFPPSLSAR